MSESIKRRTERVSELLERLAKEMAKGVPVIVEGRNDADALRRLDLRGDIILAKSSGKSFLDVLGEAKERGKRDAVLLMDFDRRGREWTMRLMRNFERMGVKPNLVFWRELRGLVGRDVKDIEGLATYMETLHRKLKGQEIN